VIRVIIAPINVINMYKFEDIPLMIKLMSTMIIIISAFWSVAILKTIGMKLSLVQKG